MPRHVLNSDDTCYFSKILRQNVDLERKKRLTKFVCVGEDQSTFEPSVAPEDKLLVAIPIVSKRIIVPKDVNFQKYPGKEWDQAHRLSQIFKYAIRTVIHRIRVEKEMRKNREIEEKVRIQKETELRDIKSELDHVKFPESFDISKFRVPIKHTKPKKDWPSTMLSVNSNQLVSRVPPEVSVGMKMSTYEPYTLPQGEIAIQLPWRIKEVDLKLANIAEIQKLMSTKGVQLLLQSKPMPASNHSKITLKSPDSVLLYSQTPTSDLPSVDFSKKLGVIEKIEKEYKTNHVLHL